MNWQIDWEAINQGLQVAGYGLCGVFAVLILFYVVTKLMLMISTKISGK